MGLSDDDDEDHKEIINDYDEFISELDLEADMPRLPDILEDSRFFNKRTLQNTQIKKLTSPNSNEGKMIEITRALKLKLSVPLYPQLCVK